MHNNICKVKLSIIINHLNNSFAIDKSLESSQQLVNIINKDISSAKWTRSLIQSELARSFKVNSLHSFKVNSLRSFKVNSLHSFKVNKNYYVILFKVKTFQNILQFAKVKFKVNYFFFTLIFFFSGSNQNILLQRCLQST